MVIARAGERTALCSTRQEDSTVSLEVDSQFYQSSNADAVKQAAKQHNRANAGWYREAPKQAKHGDG